jgi:hypothetical protein
LMTMPSPFRNLKAKPSLRNNSDGHVLAMLLLSPAFLRNMGSQLPARDALRNMGSQFNTRVASLSPGAGVLVDPSGREGTFPIPSRIFSHSEHAPQVTPSPQRVTWLSLFGAAYATSSRLGRGDPLECVCQRSESLLSLMSSSCFWCCLHWCKHVSC